MPNAISRRGLLAATVAAPLARPAIAQNKPEKLVFVGDNGPWHYCLVEEVGPAFEKETGIKVDFTLLPIARSLGVESEPLRGAA